MSLSRLSILNVGYPLHPVSSGAAGGCEQILFLLDRGLVAAGHNSLIAAAAGSEVSGRLFATPAHEGEITEDTRARVQKLHACTIQRVLRENRVDLIHFHGLDFHAYQPETSVPKLATMHLPIDWYPPVALNGNNITLTCVSASQVRSAPNGHHLLSVGNGIDLEAYRASGRKQDFLLWLGRICPEKGVDIALRVAHRLDLPLLLAGPVHAYPEHERYFDERVKPLLDCKRRHLGPVGLQEKAKLLAEARCLLVPSLVSETSSLVGMEAIASGTPVIAFNAGALAEVVEHERTGFIVDSEDEMAKAVERTSAINPEVCRSRAALRFDYRRMANDYVALYRRLIESAR